MINYEIIDFLEFFKTQKVFDAEINKELYTVTSSEGITLRIYMIGIDGIIIFSLVSKEGTELLTFSLHNMVSINCDKNKPNVIRFLFYQKDKKNPVVTALIRPTVALSLDIEQQ